MRNDRCLKLSFLYFIFYFIKLKINKKMDSEEPLRENNADKRLYRINANEEIDSKFGFPKHRSSIEKIGWLINFQPVCYYLLFYKRLSDLN